MNTEERTERRATYSWFRDDVEARRGLGAGRFTAVNNALWLIVAAVITAGFYAILSPFSGSQLIQVFTKRGVFQYVECFSPSGRSSSSSPSGTRSGFSGGRWG